MFKIGEIVFGVGMHANECGTVVARDVNSFCVQWEAQGLVVYAHDTTLVVRPKTKHVSGWANVFRTVNSEGKSYYLGSEIFPSQEAGVQTAAKVRVPDAYVDTVPVEWEDRKNA